MKSEIPNLTELLNINCENIDFKNIDIESDIDKYNNSLNTFGNYIPVPKLECWYDEKHVYPNIDPRHRFIVDTIKKK